MRARAYAGFEQMTKSFDNPKIVLLNVELELKAERDNAEVRISDVAAYQKIVDAEWDIIYDKLAKIVASGANIVLSKLAIGDLATQYFADRGLFCAGRVEPHGHEAHGARHGRPGADVVQRPEPRPSSARASTSRRSRSAASATTSSRAARPRRRARSCFAAARAVHRGGRALAARCHHEHAPVIAEAAAALAARRPTRSSFVRAGC